MSGDHRSYQAGMSVKIGGEACVALITEICMVNLTAHVLTWSRCMARRQLLIGKLCHRVHSKS